jgi:hypothetical protein
MITLLSVHRLTNGMHLTLNLADDSTVTVTLQRVSNDKPAELVHTEVGIDQHDIDPIGRACGRIMEKAYGSAQHDSKEWSQIWKAMTRYALPGGAPIQGGPAPAPPSDKFENVARFVGFPQAAPVAAKAKPAVEDDGGGLF